MALSAFTLRSTVMNAQILSAKSAFPERCACQMRSIAPGLIWKMCYDLVMRIGSVYYPESENPIFQVSISDILGLNDRVIRPAKVQVVHNG